MKRINDKLWDNVCADSKSFLFIVFNLARSSTEKMAAHLLTRPPDDQLFCLLHFSLNCCIFLARI